MGQQTPALRRLGPGGLSLVFSGAFQALVGFAANLVLVRFLAPEEFGRFVLVLAGAHLVFGILSLRCNILIVRMPERLLDARQRAIYFSAITIETVAGLLLAFAWLAVAGWQSVHEGLLVLVVGLNHWLGQNRAFFERRMRYHGLSAVEGGAALLAHGASVAAVLGGLGPVALYLREYCLVAMQALGLLWLRAIGLHRLRWLGLAEWRRIVTEARGVWLDSMLEGSFQRIVMLAVGTMGGERAAGFFWQAYRLAIVPHQLIAPLVNRMLPAWFGRVDDGARRRQGRRRALLLLSGPLLAAALAGLFLAEPVVPFIFGEAWRPAAPLLAAMSGMVFFLTLFETSRVYCLSVRHTGVLLAGRIAQYAGFLVPLLPLFLPVPIGMEAAAWGLSIAFGAAFLTVEAALRRAERVDGEGR